MKLVDIKDDNGTSLQAYADTLMQKADEKGVIVVVLALTPPDGLQVLHNTANPAALPDVLSQMAAQMRKRLSKREVRGDLKDGGKVH